MLKYPSVTLGIAAYKASANIEQLVEILLAQRGDFRLEAVLVHVDASEDGTLDMARKINSGLVKVLFTDPRKGFAKAVKLLLESSTSDITIIFNDDIKISDVNLVGKIVAEFIAEERVGLVTGNPQPLTPTTFVEKGIVSSFRAYEKLRLDIKDGHNYFSCDGKILAFSRNFKARLLEVESFDGMGNVDVYLYLFCLEQGFLYKHARDARAYFRNPTNTRDFIRWFIRNNANGKILENRYKALFYKESKIPKKIWKYMFVEFVKSPLPSLFLFLCGFYIRFASKRYANNFAQTWVSIDSSKKL